MGKNASRRATPSLSIVRYYVREHLYPTPYMKNINSVRLQFYVTFLRVTNVIIEFKVEAILLELWYA